MPFRSPVGGQTGCRGHSDRIANLSITGRCLAIQGSDNVNGSTAFQFDCLNFPDQRWVLQTV